MTNTNRKKAVQNNAQDNSPIIVHVGEEEVQCDPWVGINDLLGTLFAMFGPCKHKPPRLSKPPSNPGQVAFVLSGTQPVAPGHYTYEPKEKSPFHYRFGYLAQPSSLNHSDTRVVQLDPKRQNLNFRPADAVPWLPLQLVHPVFAQFLDDIRAGDLRPTETDSAFFTQLSVTASEILDENKLKVKVHELFEGFLEGIMVVDEMNTGVLKQGDTRDVGARVGNKMCLAMEIKKGVSGNSSDPQMQGIANYKLHWTMRNPGQAEAYADTAYPAFLLEMVGQQVHIGGLVTLGSRDDEFGGKVCYQPLATFDLYAIHKYDEVMPVLAMKVFMALKKALGSLQEYWLQLEQRRETPDMNLEDLIHNRKVPFLLHPFGDRLKQIGKRLVYVVRGGVGQRYPEDTVVKFVQRYGGLVHRAWAAAGFAPKYLGSNNAPGGGWCMVAMELLKEEDNWHCLGAMEEKAADGLRPQVLEYLARAHSIEVSSGDPEVVGYGVHGDMRDANVMVQLDRGILKGVKFIDFDWAKVQGDAEAVYPYFLNPAISWSAGVRDGLPMLQQHDRSLLQLSRKQQLADSRPLKKPRNVVPDLLEGLEL